MAKVILKERQFEPLGISLGEFEPKDLETFDIQFEDFKKAQQEGGDSGQKGPVSHVPDPYDEDPIEQDKPKGGSNGGGNDGKSQNPDAPQPQEPEEPKFNDLPTKWDVNGTNPDDEDPDMPDPVDNPNTPGGGGGGEQQDSDNPNGNDGPTQMADDRESNIKPNQIDGENPNNPDNSNNGQGDNNNPGNQGGPEGEGGEGGDGESPDSPNGGQGGKPGNNDPNGPDGGDENQPDNPNGPGQKGGDRENPDEPGDEPGGGGGDPWDSPDEPWDEPGDEPGGGTPTEPSGPDGGNNGPTGPSKGMDEGPMHNGPIEDEDDWNPWGDGEQKPSSIEEMLKKVQDSESATSKARREAEEEEDGGDKGPAKRDPVKMRDREEEAAAAKEVLSKAIQDKNEYDETHPKPTTDTTEIEDVEGEALASLGAGRLTTLFNPNNAKDWRTRLDKLFDKALGLDIVTNPNLVNKKIEDAPPGREDFDPVMKNIVVLLDCSGSMGADKFKEVIGHIDTMLKARKMTRVTFHIFPWGTSNVSELLQKYTRCKGSNFKATILRMHEERWGTSLTPIVTLVAKKVHKPDAVIILTDAEIGDSYAFRSSNICTAYIKKYRDRIIWALTSDGSVSTMEQFDPTAKLKKRFIKFKKGGGMK